jgi:hypothetical protein
MATKQTGPLRTPQTDDDPLGSNRVAHGRSGDHGTVAGANPTRQGRTSARPDKVPTCRNSFGRSVTRRRLHVHLRNESTFVALLDCTLLRASVRLLLRGLPSHRPASWFPSFPAANLPGKRPGSSSARISKPNTREAYIREAKQFAKRRYQADLFHGRRSWQQPRRV